jgi:rubrerythrin
MIMSTACCIICRRSWRRIEEIMATAHALEDAAVQRYRKLAAAMRAVAHEDVAQVFDDLTAEEEQHVLSVEKMTRKLLQRMPADCVVRWVLPETFGADEAGPPALLTPYKALSIAVRAEERAFAFWSYVAANAAAEPVRPGRNHGATGTAARFRFASRAGAPTTQRSGDSQCRSADSRSASKGCVPKPCDGGKLRPSLRGCRAP